MRDKRFHADRPTLAATLALLANWLAALLITLSLPRPCAALPLGKAWVPTADLSLPGFVYLGSPRFDWDGSVLTVQTMPRRFGGGDAIGLVWADSVWAQTWSLGYPTLFLWPVLAPENQVHLVWGGASQGTAGTYLTSQIIEGTLSVPDTITHAAVARSYYSLAVGEHRKWFVVSDNASSPSFPGGGIVLRGFLSDAPGVWEEVPVSGGGGAGVCVAALDDTTALVVWAGPDEGLRWGTLRGRNWDYGGLLDDEFAPQFPRLRVRPSGGFWLAWGNLTPEVRISSFRNGVWSPSTAVTAEYPVPHSQHFSEASDLSRDNGEFPVVAWGTYSPLSGGEVSVSIPKAGEYSDGEVIPGSEYGVLPSVARDSNRDVWVAWWSAFGPTRWTHTYTKATPVRVALDSRGRRRSLAWTLDEPAPESWWTVLRARGDGPFEEAARVQAGEGVEVSWADDSPPAGHLRYKVRRDCLDTRYRWESEEVAWPPGLAKRGPAPRLPSLKRPATPFGQIAELELTGAATDSYEVSLYDLQGRRVLTRQTQGATTGRLRFSLDGATPAVVSGIYYAKVRDAAGVESNAVRVVVLR